MIRQASPVRCTSSSARARSGNSGRTSSPTAASAGESTCSCEEARSGTTRPTSRRRTRTHRTAPAGRLAVGGRFNARRRCRRRAKRGPWDQRRQANNAAPSTHNSATFAGAACIFERDGTTWHQQASIKPRNTSFVTSLAGVSPWRTESGVGGDPSIRAHPRRALSSSARSRVLRDTDARNIVDTESVFRSRARKSWRGARLTSLGISTRSEHDGMPAGAGE